MKRVILGMSGGVDSSVAAAILLEQGYEVAGLFMRNWEERDIDGVCTAEEDFADVKSVASKLGIPYYTVNFAKEYEERVFKEFVDGYQNGRTPNPDVLCNREIKFGLFYDYAMSLGADYVATGHYCNVSVEDGIAYLKTAKDTDKDQTYFLNQVRGEKLKNVLFPIGSMVKSEVRAIAEKYGFRTAVKKDSTGICFIGERNFRSFLSQYIPMKAGDILDLEGNKVGRHNGVYYYTLGQRRGLGIGGTADGDGRWFVVSRDVKNNVLYVSHGDETPLYSSELTCTDFNFISGTRIMDGTPGCASPTGFRCSARIRHRQPPQDAAAYIEGDTVRVIFDRSQRAIATGQYCVLYVRDICVGGGVSV